MQQPLHALTLHYTSYGVYTLAHLNVLQTLSCVFRHVQGRVLCLSLFRRDGHTSVSSFAFRFRKLTFFKASSLIASVMARGTHSHFELMARARAERSRVRRLSFTGTQVLSDLNTLWAVDQFSRLNTLI